MWKIIILAIVLMTINLSYANDGSEDILADSLRYGVLVPHAPRLTFIQPLVIEDNGSIHEVDVPHKTVEAEQQPAIPPILFDAAREVAKPVREFNKEEAKYYDETPMFVYADASAMLLSFMIRQATENKFDLLLLTEHETYAETVLVNGVEFGIRPDPLLGFRVRVQDNVTMEDERLYGMELQIYPTKDTSIRLLRDTEETTELELTTKF